MKRTCDTNYEPIDGYRVAVIKDRDVPIELIQTALPMKRLGSEPAPEGSIYR
jgi:hypothetical protein